jgi:hypothetical protein
MVDAVIEREGLTLKISLEGMHPVIWRRVVVPAAITLDRLHDILQIVMGWHDNHAHEFDFSGRRFTEDPDPAEADVREEGTVRLCDVANTVLQHFVYDYDLGDSCWRHRVVVEGRVAPDGDEPVEPRCLEGQRACPPEDVGGIGGYRHFLAVIADPDAPEHDEYLDWCGGRFKPQAFNCDAVNVDLAKYRRWSRTRACR